MITFGTDGYDFEVRFFWGALLTIKVVIPLKFLVGVLNLNWTTL